MEIAGKSSCKRKYETKKLSKNHYTKNSAKRSQRNQAEKLRRDRMSDLIAQLGAIVPPAVNASKALDKVSILRLSASWMRLNYSCLNQKHFKSAAVNYLNRHHSLVSNLDKLEKSINGFIIATTFSGIILMCSRFSEEFIGYQNVDLLGHHITNFIHHKERELFQKKIRNLISKFKRKSTNLQNIVRVHMRLPVPRSHNARYKKMSITLTVHSRTSITKDTSNVKKNIDDQHRDRRQDFGENAVLLMFVEPVRMKPDIDVQYLGEKDCYLTVHSPQGEIIFADHRISIMTGYMPRDVLGTSAYHYIHSSDVPIAQFAQKAMFASSDGTGTITYRLRICDSSFIYLESKGQIKYKDSTKEVLQFICCNILLNAEDGRQKLQNFQDRFAPFLLSSKSKDNGMGIKSESLENPSALKPANTSNFTNTSLRSNCKYQNYAQAAQSSCSFTALSMQTKEDIVKDSKSYKYPSLKTVDGATKYNHQRNSLPSSNYERNPSCSETLSSKNEYSDICDDTKVLDNCGTANRLMSNQLSIIDFKYDKADSELNAFLPFSNTSQNVMYPSSESNCVPLGVNCNQSDISLILNDFIPYSDVEDKNNLAQTIFNCSSYPLSSKTKVQNNFDNNNQVFNSEQSFVPQHTFQNLGTNYFAPGIIPNKANSLDVKLANCVNAMSNSPAENGLYLDNHSAHLNKSHVEMCRKPTSGCLSNNFDLSFLDETVENLDLTGDLNYLYENSQFLQSQMNLENLYNMSTNSDIKSNNIYDCDSFKNINDLNDVANFNFQNLSNLGNKFIPNSTKPQQYNCSSKPYFLTNNGTFRQNNNTEASIFNGVLSESAVQELKRTESSTSQTMKKRSFYQHPTNLPTTPFDIKKKMNLCQKQNEIYSDPRNLISHNRAQNRISSETYPFAKFL